MAHVFYPSGSRTYIRQVSGSNLYEFFVSTQEGFIFYLTGSGYDTASLITASYAISASYAQNGGGSSYNNIFESGSNVGIGIQTPTARLHLESGSTLASTAPLKFTSGQLLETPESGSVEFLTDDLYITITTGDTPLSYSSQYPPEYNSTYVKATSETIYSAWLATQPTGSLIDNYPLWMTTAPTNQRFHIDLGTARVIKRIYYENSHFSGANTDRGIKNVTVWGSNTGSAFATLTYATDTNWTYLATGSFDRHINTDIADPKYFLFSNTASFRYYAVKISDNHGNSQYMGVRRIELQEAIYGSGSRKLLTINDIPLTANRVPFVTTNGRLTDSPSMSFDGTTLTVTSSCARSASYATTASVLNPTAPVYGTDSSSFNPITGISTGSCILWLRGSSGSFTDQFGMRQCKSNGELVRRWNDLSNTGSHLHPHTAEYNRMSYVTETGPNNTHVGILNDVAIGQKIYSDTITTPIKPIWVFSVLKAKSSGSAMGCPIVDGTGTGTRMMCLAGEQPQIYGGATLLAPATASLGNNWILTSFKNNGASSLIRANGIEIVSGNAGTNYPIGFTVGSDQAGNSSTPVIFLEVLVYTSIADDDAYNIERYLNDRYGLGLSL